MNKKIYYEVMASVVSLPYLKIIRINIQNLVPLEYSQWTWAKLGQIVAEFRSNMTLTWAQYKPNSSLIIELSLIQISVKFEQN